MFFLLVLTFAFIPGSGNLAADNLIHVVGRGETIYSISRFYQVSADDLMRTNNITDPSRLLVGARLIIPSTEETPAASMANTQTLTDYRVVRGDTLYSIARANGITLQNLQEINRFPSNHVLRVGDVVKIPARNTAAATTTAGTAASVPQTAPAGLYSLRWPVTPKDISYMTGQAGVIVEGEFHESVRSLTQGSVISAGPWRKYGRVVVIEASGGYFYMYGGCEVLSVNVGDRITPGMELGKLGINSVSEKPQLFFMVFRNDNPIDPAQAPRAGTAQISSGNN